MSNHTFVKSLIVYARVAGLAYVINILIGIFNVRQGSSGLEGPELRISGKTYLRKPVPAGMSFPTMRFSLMPRKSSRLPLMAA